MWSHWAIPGLCLHILATSVVHVACSSSMFFFCVSPCACCRFQNHVCFACCSQPLGSIAIGPSHCQALPSATSHGSTLQDGQAHQGHEGHEDHEGHQDHQGHEVHEGHQRHEGSQDQGQGQQQSPGHAAIAASASTALDGHILQCQELPILALGVQAVDIRQLHKVWQAMGPELAHHQAQCLGPRRTRQPNSGHFSRHQLLQQSFEEEKNGWCAFWFIMV